MQDRELYRQILGVESPWKGERVELRRADGEVHVFLEHDERVLWRCPECNVECTLHDHQPERRWRHRGYVSYPTTRNGQVNAEVVQIACRVSGPIVNVAVSDNQLVREGDLLFEIDPSTFEVSQAQAQAQMDETRDDLDAGAAAVTSAKAALIQARAKVDYSAAEVHKAEIQLEYDKVTFERYANLVKRGGVSQNDYDQNKARYEGSQASLEEARTGLAVSKTGVVKGEAAVGEAEAQLGAAGDANARLRAAKAAVEQAALDLSFTRVYASVDGYVANLNVHPGAHAVANSPLLALIEADSLRVDGFFKETLMEYIAPGAPAVVVLMGYPDQLLKGRVESIGWGIAQQDGSPGTFLLPNVNPTFDWIRLAQRIPVRVKLEEVPPNVRLRVGTTASVQIKTAVPLVRDLR